MGTTTSCPNYIAPYVVFSTFTSWKIVTQEATVHLFANFFSLLGWPCIINKNLQQGVHDKHIQKQTLNETICRSRCIGESGAEKATWKNELYVYVNLYKTTTYTKPCYLSFTNTFGKTYQKLLQNFFTNL